MQRSGDALRPSSARRGPVPSAQWCEVTSSGTGKHAVRMGGQFGPEWMANLCQGIADHHLSIESAYAARLPDQSWKAELSLLRLEGGSDAEQVPFVMLALENRSNPARWLVLERYELVSTNEHGGTLRVEIVADDELGLLGALLAQFAKLVLFPVAMQIDTQRGRAYDCFWLSSIGGTLPAANLRAALDRALHQVLRPR